MATAIEGRDVPAHARSKTWSPDRYEQFLAAGAAVLLAIVLVAIGRGCAHWHEATLAVWLHLVTILVALGLTPVMLLRQRGDRWHRRLGWLWSASMVATAALSFLVRQSNPGHFSFIHILSAWVLVQVPILVWTARTHKVRSHRRSVRGIVTGALLIAGFFTLPFGRMLGVWLLG